MSVIYIYAYILYYIYIYIYIYIIYILYIIYIYIHIYECIYLYMFKKDIFVIIPVIFPFFMNLLQTYLNKSVKNIYLARIVTR